MEKDRESQTANFSNIDGALKRALPPTLYYNFLMGESKDLIFGTSLVDYATTHGQTGGPGVALGLARGGKLTMKEGVASREERHKRDAIGVAQECVPRLIRICVRDIDARGLTTEGIYRVRDSAYPEVLATNLFYPLSRCRFPAGMRTSKRCGVASSKEVPD